VILCSFLSHFLFLIFSLARYYASTL
jgi:hypothetical protein